MTNTPFERIWDQHVIDDYGGGRALIHIDRHFAHEGTSARAFDGLRRGWAEGAAAGPDGGDDRSWDFDRCRAGR